MKTKNVFSFNNKYIKFINQVNEMKLNKKYGNYVFNDFVREIIEI